MSGYLLRQSKEEVMSTFKRRRKVQMAISGSMIALILISWLGASRGAKYFQHIPPHYLGLTFGALILASLVLSLINWRCPACNTYLGKKISPRFCSKCGTELMDK